MTPFPCRFGVSKLFCSFSAGFNSTFYGTFYFVKCPIKTEHNTLRFDWLVNPFSLYIFVKRYSSKQTLILISTHSVINNIIHTIRYSIRQNQTTINLVKLSTEAAIRRCSSVITGNHLCWSLFLIPYFSYCFIKFPFFWFLRVRFLKALTNWKIPRVHLLVFSEAGIERPKSSIFFKNWT